MDGVADPSTIQLPSLDGVIVLGTFVDGIGGNAYGCGVGCCVLFTVGWNVTSTSKSPDMPDLGEAVEARIDGTLLRVTSVPACDEPLVDEPVVPSDADALE